jgi:hypothetical protein
VRRIAIAPDRLVDSYEALTTATLVVDKRVHGRDAAPMELAVVLALGGLFALFIIGGGILMFVLAGVAIWKMRSDDFWEEPPG